MYKTLLHLYNISLSAIVKWIGKMSYVYSAKLCKSVKRLKIWNLFFVIIFTEKEKKQKQKNDMTKFSQPLFSLKVTRALLQTLLLNVPFVWRLVFQHPSLEHKEEKKKKREKGVSTSLLSFINLNQSSQNTSLSSPFTTQDWCHNKTITPQPASRAQYQNPSAISSRMQNIWASWQNPLVISHKSPGYWSQTGMENINTFRDDKIRTKIIAEQ